MSDDDILKFDGETGDPMTWTADQALEIETRAILAAFPSVRVERSGAGWLIGLGFEPGQIHHAGHTSIDPLTSDDPRDMARRLVDVARREESLSAMSRAAQEPKVAAAANDDFRLIQPREGALADRLVAPVPSAGFGAGAFGAGPFNGVRAKPEAQAPEIVTQANGAVMIVNLPNDRSEAQALVRSAISEAKLIRLDSAEPAGWMAELIQLEGWHADDVRRDGHALPAMTEEQRARLAELWAVRSRVEAINRHAAELERTARDADLPMLQAMALDVWQGGPK